MTTFVVNGTVPFENTQQLTFHTFADFIQFIRPYFLAEDGYKTQRALQDAIESGQVYDSAADLMEDVLREMSHEV